MSNEHLSAEQVTRYQKNDLLPDEIADVYLHLDICASCRERVKEPVSSPFLGFRTDLLTGEWETPNHPDEEQQAAYVDGTLERIERQLLESHLETCPRCVEEIRNLRAFRAILSTYPAETIEPLSPPTFRDRLAALWRLPALRFTLQTAVPVAVTVLLFVLWGRGRKPAPISPVPTDTTQQVARLNSELQRAQAQSRIAEQKTSQLAAAEANNRKNFARMTADLQHQLEDARKVHPAPNNTALAAVGGNLYRDARGELLMTVPRGDSAALLTAMTDGKLTTLAGLNELNTHSALLGDGQAKAVQPIEPVGTFVASNRPTFRWKEVPGARHYILHIQTPERQFVADVHLDWSADQQWKVTLHNSDGGSIGEPTTTSSGTTWTDTGAAPILSAGHAYQWTVKAVDDPNDDTANADRPTLPAKFEVLDAAQQEEVHSAMARYADSHLVLGILLAAHGLVPEARQQLEEQRRLEPGNALVRKLLAQLPAPPSAH